MVFSQIHNSAEHRPVRTTKADQDFLKRLDFQDIKSTVKTRDIHKICYVSKLCCEGKHVYLLLIWEEGKMH